jgi:large subunit ribosomal protein L16
MLQPNRTKYRKVQKGKSKLRGTAKGGTQLNFGRYGLKATSSARVSARQIEAARRSITRHMRRVGKLWIRIFPDVPITDKPAEVRMGKGKGTVEWWCARVRPGRVIFELDGVSQEVAEEAFRLASAKLPVETKFVTRLEG